MRPIRVGSIDWGVFKSSFFDRFFPVELREKNLVEFMNPHQRGISLTEYPLNLTKLSKYAPTLQKNSRDRMNKFVTGSSRLV